MKKLITLFALIVVAVSASAQFQTPKLEVGLSYVFKHQEGFGIPRFTVGLNEMFKGFGLYATPEYRGGIEFKEDGTNYYFRMPTGLNYRHSSGIGVFAGGDLLSVAMGKNLRKEVGLSYLLRNGITLQASYSNWVGAAAGIGYQFGTKQPKKQSPPVVPVLEPVKREEPIQETPKPAEPVSEVAPVEPIVAEESVAKDPVLLLVVRFEFNSIVLTPESRVELDALVTTYKSKYNKKDLMIVGHTDPKGSDEVNDRIGLQRAQAVAKYLEVNYGIQNVKIVVRSEGERKIISTDDSINRRSEVYVIL
ncbi:MAG: OmpA family protein [Flavobacteriaceae bacterium]|nr:OmpA family protein [Flavobacteriaceae bacterium]